jgi:hypothetical protein
MIKTFAFHFIMHITYMRKHCDGETIDLEILTDLHVSCTPENETVAFGIPFVCLSLCMHGPSLAPERLNGFYSYSVSTDQPRVNMSTLASRGKIAIFQQYMETTRPE